MSNTDSGDGARFDSGEDGPDDSAESGAASAGAAATTGTSRWQRELQVAPKAPLWKRRSVWLATAVVVVVLAGAGVTVSLLGGDGDAPANAGTRSHTCSAADRSSAPPDDPISAPKKGNVTVEEKGTFHYGHDYDGDYKDYVSFGATFKNTSNAIAYHTNINFTLTDSEGHKLTVDNQQFKQLSHQQIPLLEPGKSAGLGGTIKIPNKDFTKDGEDVKVSIKVGESQWWPAHSNIKQLHKTHNTNFKYDTQTNNFVIIPRWDVTSCQPVPGLGASTVLRDTHGDIIGGTPSYPTAEFDLHEPDQVWKGQTAFIQAFHQPGQGLLDIIDKDATEVTVYPEHVNCDTGKLTAKAKRNVADSWCLVDLEQQ